MTILEHPAYKAMYPQNRVIEGEQDITPTDDFWYNYLAQFYKGKNIYTSKKLPLMRGEFACFPLSVVRLRAMGQVLGIQTAFQEHYL